MPDTSYVTAPPTKGEMTKDDTTNSSALTSTSTFSFTSTCRLGYVRRTARSTAHEAAARVALGEHRLLEVQARIVVSAWATTCFDQLAAGKNPFLCSCPDKNPQFGRAPLLLDGISHGILLLGLTRCHNPLLPVASRDTGGGGTTIRTTFDWSNLTIGYYTPEDGCQMVSGAPNPTCNRRCRRWLGRGTKNLEPRTRRGHPPITQITQIVVQDAGAEKDHPQITQITQIARRGQWRTANKAEVR